jgi:hypothetical protein
MKPTNRRVFMIQAVSAGSVLAGSAGLARANAPEKLTEADPYARSMGFRYDTTQVDQKRYPRHNAKQNCATCQLFDGKDTDEWGPCSFFGGRLVKSTGWCRNFKVRGAA